MRPDTHDTVFDDYDVCFRCKANPPAPGGDACTGCRRYLAGYTDIDPKDSAPPRRGLTDAQAEYAIAMASARGLDVTRADLEELYDRRDDADRIDIGDPRERVINDGWAVQNEAGDWLTGEAGVAYIDERGPSYA